MAPWTFLCEMTEMCWFVRYIITDIIGMDEGLGVENLRGSGTIAGESSQAYEEIITISMVRMWIWLPSAVIPSLLFSSYLSHSLLLQVTCRAIGIGAYLVRLGQRVIQVENSHIILTGASALNKVCGSSLLFSYVLLCTSQPLCVSAVEGWFVAVKFNSRNKLNVKMRQKKWNGTGKRIGQSTHQKLFNINDCFSCNTQVPQIKSWKFESLLVYRFWAERSTPPTTSWEESRSCTTMEWLTPRCPMTLRASSPSCSGSPTCQRFGWICEVRPTHNNRTRSLTRVLLSSQNKHSPVPVIAAKDPVDREIEFTPTKAPYDPRWMLAGRPHPSEFIWNNVSFSSKANKFPLIWTFFIGVISGERRLAERILRPRLFHGDHGVLG